MNGYSLGMRGARPRGLANGSQSNAFRVGRPYGRKYLWIGRRNDNGDEGRSLSAARIQTFLFKRKEPVQHQWGYKGA
jgi:hypothetical protein